ncbi:unnamed protein product [Rotaria sp. Silwood2]|nr:unnamed protein product [Rotaria sp. Silwood2]
MASENNSSTEDKSFLPKFIKWPLDTGLEDDEFRAGYPFRSTTPVNSNDLCQMDNFNINNSNMSTNSSIMFSSQLSGSSKYHREQQFNQILEQLTVASNALNYEEQITAIVTIYENLMVPLTFTPPTQFDSTVHKIDPIAQKYLEQASKSVQHLVAIKTLDDGNCLFNCITSLMPNSDLSAVELRVRTVVELIKNKTYYINKYAYLIGPIDEAIRRACNNNQFSELYELAALANVIQCEIRSVYPYIDYRAEMKNMNAIYKPIQSSTPIRGYVIIFWTSSRDEVTTRSRTNSGGIWSPNHFVPLVKYDENLNVLDDNQTPEKTTTKNNQTSLIRTPDFSSTRDVRKRFNSSTELSSSFQQLLTNSKSLDAERKHRERIEENEQQRNERLARDQLHKRIMRATENDQQRNERLADQRHRSAQNRLNENEQRRSIRLASTRERWKESQENKDEEQKLRRVRSISMRRRQKIIAKKQQTESNRFHWPSAIPNQLKERCLQDFIKQMSMNTLR